VDYEACHHDKQLMYAVKILRFSRTHELFIVLFNLCAIVSWRNKKLSYRLETGRQLCYTYMTTLPQRHRQTDIQTDRQTTFWWHKPRNNKVKKMYSNDSSFSQYKVYSRGSWRGGVKRQWGRRKRGFSVFVARLLSITVITETYVCHVRNLRPMHCWKNLGF